MKASDHASPAQYLIRPLMAADVSAFMSLRSEGLELNPEAFGESAEEFKAKTPEMVLQRLRSVEQRGGFTLGAFAQKGELIGIVGMAPFEGAKSRHRGYVWGMFVTRQHRGKGLGRALLVECIERARRVDGLDHLVLSVASGNNPALELYRAIGFQVYGTDRRALKVSGRWIDESLMWLPLRD